MINLDHEIVAHIVFSELKVAEKTKVTPDMLEHEAYQKALSCIRKHILQFQAVPTPQIVFNETGIMFNKPNSDIGYVQDEVRKRFIHAKTQSAIEFFGKKLINKDYDGILDNLGQFERMINNGVLSNTKVRDMFIGNEGIWEDFLRMERGDIGILSPWPLINQLMLGYQKGELTMLGARKGVGKTYFSMMQLKENFKHRVKTLYISPEMHSKSLVNRFASLYLEINNNKIRAGQLSESSRKRYMDFILNPPQEFKDLVFIFGDEYEMDIESLKREIAILQPQMIIIDGVYLLRVKGEPDRIKRAAIIADEIKIMAKRNNVPVLATTQLNKEAALLKVKDIEAEHFVLSDNFAWVTDWGFIIGRDGEDKENKQMKLKPVKTREGDGGETVTLNWDFNNFNFTQIENKGFASTKDKPKNKNQSDMFAPPPINEPPLTDEDIPF